MKQKTYLKKLSGSVILKTLCLTALVLTAHATIAQIHSAHTSTESKAEDFPAWKNVLTTALTDSGLVNKEIKFLQITLEPGSRDTVAHRHPCEVFLYVQEGALEYREGKNNPVIYKKGEILHEIPNSLHTLHGNPSKTEQTKLLIVFLYTKGKPTYVREYPENKK